MIKIKNSLDVVPVVLVVDDNPKNLQLVALILRDLKYKIVIADSGQKAIELYDRVKPDLVLLDIMMPGMDGFEACSIIKSREGSQNIPVIFLTALDDKSNLIKGFELGGVDYITKPFNNDELVSRIKTHLELKFTRDELVKSTENLTRLNAIKDKMFSIIGHDLRSPIGHVKMTLELLLSQIGTVKPSDFYDSIEMLTKTSGEVFSLLENLLWWARSQNGSLNVLPENVNLSSIVQSVYFLNKGNLKWKELQFKTDIDESDFVYCDLNMFKTVLRNLISNAIKFTPQHGTIRVSSRSKGNTVELSVADSGIGIPPENIAKLLDENQHVSTNGTNNESGSGLGLVLCVNFVRLNNGVVSVESELGKGSEFRVTLPKGISENLKSE